MRSPPQSPIQVWGRRLLSLAAVSGIAASAWLVVAWRTATAQVCIEPAGASLTLLEMGELRQTLRRHQGDLSAPMRLTQDQLTFVLVDHLAYPVSFRLFGDRLEMFASVPTSRGCANINYVGGLAVEDGNVRLHPQRVRVGSVVLPRGAANWALRQTSFASLRLRDDAFLRAVHRVVLDNGEAEVWLNTSERLW